MNGRAAFLIDGMGVEAGLLERLSDRHRGSPAFGMHVGDPKRVGAGTVADDLGDGLDASFPGMLQ